MATGSVPAAVTLDYHKASGNYRTAANAVYIFNILIKQ